MYVLHAVVMLDWTSTAYFVSTTCVLLKGIFFALSFTECFDGTFGLGCTGQCTCQNNGTCNVVDGSCNCTEGYNGISCEQHNLSLIACSCFFALMITLPNISHQTAIAPQIKNRFDQDKKPDEVRHNNYSCIQRRAINKQIREVCERVWCIPPSFIPRPS